MISHRSTVSAFKQSRLSPFVEKAMDERNNSQAKSRLSWHTAGTPLDAIMLSHTSHHHAAECLATSYIAVSFIREPSQPGGYAEQAFTISHRHISP